MRKTRTISVDVCFLWHFGIQRCIFVIFFHLFLFTLGTTSSSISQIRIKKSENSQNFTILSSPSKLSVLERDSVVFPCRVDKSENVVVMWKKGKSQLLFAGPMAVEPDKKFGLINQTSLQISFVTAEYAGEYTCYINGHTDIMLTHELHVLIPPKIVLDHDERHIIVKKGDSISAKCNAKGNPKPVITWKALKGSLPGGMREIQGQTLNISSADVNHSGIYECNAENGVRSPDSAIIRVKVLYAPEIHITPEWIHAGVGSNVELQCTAISEPIATLYWTRGNGNLITEDWDTSFQIIPKSPSEESVILKLKRITPDKFGSYSCFANNSLGSIFKTVEISGLAEPVKFRSNETGDEKDSFLLSWAVKSYSPIIEYLLRVRRQNNKDSSITPSSWNEVMIPVEDEQSSIFHSRHYNITGLEAGTAYEVVIQARNDFGWNHPSDVFVFHTFSDSQTSKNFRHKQKSENIVKQNSLPKTEDNQEKSLGCCNNYGIFMFFTLFLVVIQHE